MKMLLMLYVLLFATNGFAAETHFTVQGGVQNDQVVGAATVFYGPLLAELTGGPKSYETYGPNSFGAVSVGCGIDLSSSEFSINFVPLIGVTRDRTTHLQGGLNYRLANRLIETHVRLRHYAKDNTVMQGQMLGRINEKLSLGLGIDNGLGVHGSWTNLSGLSSWCQVTLVGGRLVSGGLSYTW